MLQLDCIVTIGLYCYNWIVLNVTIGIRQKFHNSDNLILIRSSIRSTFAKQRSNELKSPCSVT